MEEFGAPERVYVELDWYDGPISGLADFNGKPHRFVAEFDFHSDDYLKKFRLWPVEASILLLEQEQWKIFVEWNDSYEQGLCATESHPGAGGISDRWDELELLLKREREEIPADAKLVLAKLIPLDRVNRYSLDGVDYKISWRLLDEF